MALDIHHIFLKLLPIQKSITQCPNNILLEIYLVPVTKVGEEGIESRTNKTYNTFFHLNLY